MAKGTTVTILEIEVEIGIVRPMRKAAMPRAWEYLAVLSITASFGDDEHSAEREQRLALGIAGIGLGYQRAIRGFELLALGSFEGLEQRAERRSLGPFGDRIDPPEDLKIGRPPNLEPQGLGHQHCVIGGCRRNRRRPQDGP